MPKDGAALDFIVQHDLNAPRSARRAVADEFSCLGRALSWAEVVVGELVANAVRHGKPPVRLLAATDDRGVRFEIHDGRPDFGAPHGESRGLQLVDRLASAWGHEPAGGGKYVWAHIAF